MLCVLSRRKVVALLAVAAPVGSHQVVESIVGVPAPRHEVVNFNAHSKGPLAVEALAMLQLAERYSKMGNRLAPCAEQKTIQLRFWQVVDSSHH